MKIISWNVNGIKSIIKDGFYDEILDQKPDILCLQEVKSEEIPDVEGYISYNYPYSDRPNLYGSAIYTKMEPISVKKGFNDSEFDREVELSDWNLKTSIYTVFMLLQVQNQNNI